VISQKVNKKLLCWERTERTNPDIHLFPSCIRPASDGDTLLEIRDLCLVSSRTPKLSVTVTGVHRVELVLTADKVQMGKEVGAQVREEKDYCLS
jgi:hypothetical protein